MNRFDLLVLANIGLWGIQACSPTVIPLGTTGGTTAGTTTGGAVSGSTGTGGDSPTSSTGTGNTSGSTTGTTSSTTTGSTSGSTTGTKTSPAPIEATITRPFAAGPAQVAYTAVVNFPQNPNGARIVVGPIGTQSAYQYFNQNIASAITARAAVVSFPKGTYTINPNSGNYQHISISAATDLIIDGQGSTLIFAGVLGGLATGNIQGIVINASQRVVLRNFIIDYDVRIASRGTVQSESAHCSGATHRYVLIDTAQYPMTDPRIQQAKIINDSNSSLWGLRQNEYYTYTAPLPLQDGNAFFPCSNNFDAALPTVGHVVTVRHFAYDGNAVGIYGPGTADIIFDGITLYASPAMGVYVGNESVRGFALENFQISKNPNDTSRLISLAADGFHFNNVAGDIVIENSEVGYQGDDGLNIVTSAPFSTTINGNDITLAQSSSNFLGLYYASPGDTFSLYTPTFGSHIYANLLSVVQESNVIGQFDYLPSLPDGVFLLDNAESTQRVYVVDNNFHDNRGRGVISRSTGVSISNNTFHNNTGPAILLGTDGINFMEGAIGRDMTVANNTIESVNQTQVTSFIGPMEYGAISLGVSCSSASGCPNTLSPNSLILNALIQENTVSAAAGIGILLANTSSTSVTGNTVVDTASTVLQSAFGGPATAAGSIHSTRATSTVLGTNTLSRPATSN